MAITYNGTPITSVLMNGVTYTTIADENGYLYYACNPVCYYVNACVGYEFSGFEYTTCGCSYLARAAICYRGDQDGNGYVRWIGGPRTCNSNMTYYNWLRFQIGCIHQQVIGSGYCGINYEFNITNNAMEIGFSKPGVNGVYCVTLNSQETCTSISGLCWTSGNRLYSDWVSICECDYIYKLNCQNIVNVCRPIIYPYCAVLYANLKNETGYDLIECCFKLNDLGSRTTDITCSIMVC